MGISSVPMSVFLVMLAFSAAIIGLGIFVAVRTRRQLQALLTAERIYPADARQGYFRVEGKAVVAGKKQVLAPLTRSPCLWYRIKVEKYERRPGTSDNRNHSDWHTIRSDESEANFLVEWDGKSIRVDPHGAEITPTDKSQWKGATEDPEDRNPPRFLPTEHALGDGVRIDISGLSDSKYRYSEERIYEGDPMFIVGEIAETGKGRFTLRKPSDRRPFLIGTTEPGKHAELQRMGIVGAMFIAGIGAAIMLWLLWTRWG